MTVSLFAQHKVEDFATWKKLFDETAPQALDRGGVIEKAVHRNLDNPNEVIVYHKFADVETLNAFMNSLQDDHFQEFAQASGVILDSMTMWVGEDV